MNVEETKAITAQHGGKTYYFCSQRCKATFESDPAKYARPS
jgi:Cu+-exporting ATPase